MLEPTKVPLVFVSCAVTCRSLLFPSVYSSDADELLPSVSSSWVLCADLFRPKLLCWVQISTALVCNLLFFIADAISLRVVFIISRVAFWLGVSLVRIFKESSQIIAGDVEAFTNLMSFFLPFMLASRVIVVSEIASGIQIKRS